MKHDSFRSLVSGARILSALALSAFCIATLATAHAADDRVPNSSGPPKVVLDVSQMDAQIAQMQALKEYSVAAQKKVNDWFPQIVSLLGAEKGTHPATVTLKIDMGYDGVAYADGTNIVVSGKYALAHPDDMGAMVHEMTHIIQAYPSYKDPWLVEGIADYVRWFNYEPVDKRPNPNPEKARYNASYGTTASFLTFVVNKYDKNLIKKLDAALKADTYTPEMFKTATGKTIDELSTEWIAQLQKSKDAATAKVK